MQKPHVSPALQHLRTWVTLAVTLLAVASFTHMLVFGFVHFTDVRWNMPVIEPPSANVSPTIVSHPKPTASTTTTAVATATPAVAPMPTEANKPRTLAAADDNLRVMDTAAVTLGLFTAVTAAALSAIGLLIAAGGAVPGIEKTVRASAVAMVLMMICLPWGQLLGAGVLPGVFSTYDVMTRASAAARESSYASATGISLLIQYLVLPILAVVGATAVGWWFRAGVERGVIITSVSEFDHHIEHELAAIRSKGAGSLAVGAGGVRTVGALNQAIGVNNPSAPAPMAPPPQPIPFRAAAGAESMTQDGDITRSLLRTKARDFDRPLGTPNAGEALKRPI